MPCTHHGGGKNANKQGNQIAAFLKDCSGEFTLLNDGSNTHFRQSKDTLLSSVIDLTLISHKLLTKSKWATTDILANHIGILTTLGSRFHTPTGIPSSRVWNTKNANWDLYQQHLDQILTDSPLASDLTDKDNLDQEAENINALITRACNKTFAHNVSNGSSNPKGKPPWMDHPEYQGLRKLANKEFQLWKLQLRNGNFEAAAIHHRNLNYFRRLYKKIGEETNTKLRSEFISTLNRSTSGSLAWRQAYRLNGIPNPPRPLLSPGEACTKAKGLITNFVARSSNDNLTDAIKEHCRKEHTQRHSNLLNAMLTSDQEMEALFTPSELTHAMKFIKVASPLVRMVYLMKFWLTHHPPYSPDS
jgi:hypothetical protein